MDYWYLLCDILGSFSDMWADNFRLLYSNTLLFRLQFMWQHHSALWSWLSFSIFCAWIKTVDVSSPRAQRCGRDPTSGKNYNSVCDPSDYCCSAFEYSGVDDTYCVDCQKGFGSCPALCDPSKPCALGGCHLYFLFLHSLLLLLVRPFPP